MPLFLFFFFVITSSPFAQKELSFDVAELQLNSVGSKDLSAHLQIWDHSEPFDTLSIEKWSPLSSSEVKHPETYWSSIKLTNSSPTRVSILLHFPGDIYALQSYTYDSLGRMQLYCTTGTTISYRSRTYKYSNSPLCPLEVAPHDTLLVVNQIVNDQTRQRKAALKVTSASNFSERETKGRVADFIYTGILLALIIFSTIGLFWLKIRSLFFYGIYLLTHLFTVLSLRGYPLFFFRMEHPIYIQYFSTLGAQICFFFFILFHQYFLRLKENSPKLNQVLNIWIGVKFVVILPLQIFQLSNDYQYLLNRWVADYHIVESLLILCSLAYFASKKIPYSRWALIANLLGISGYFLTVSLWNFKWIDSLQDSLIFTQVGLLLEALVFLFGILWQFKQKISVQFNSIKKMNHIMIQHQSRQMQTLFFVNHFLRKPVAHILGLNVILQNPSINSEEKKKALHYLNEVAVDLNEVINKLNSSLENNDSLSTEVFKGDLFKSLESKIAFIKQSSEKNQTQIDIQVPLKTGYSVVPEIEIFLTHLILFLVEQKHKSIMISHRVTHKGTWVVLRVEGNAMPFQFLKGEIKYNDFRKFSEVNPNFMLCMQIIETQIIEITFGSSLKEIEILLERSPAAERI